MQLTALIKTFDPERLYFRQAIRTCLVASIALLIAEFANFRNDLFAVWSAVFIIQVNQGLTVSKQLTTVGITGGVSAITVGIATYLQSDPLLSSLFIGLIAFSTPLLGSRGFDQWNFGFRVCLLSILAAGTPMAESGPFWSRIIQVALGTVVALLVSLLVWPHKPKRLFGNSLSATLRAASALYDSMVELVPLKQETKAVRRFHRQRDRALQLLHRNGEIWEAWTRKRPPAQEMERLEEEIDQLYEILLGLSLLHYKEIPSEVVDPLRKIGRHIHTLLDSPVRDEHCIQKTTLLMMQEIMNIEQTTQETRFLLHNLFLLVRNCDAIALLVRRVREAHG